jgi:uncharacterized protein (DUF2126 family)
VTGNTHRAEFCIDKMFRRSPRRDAAACWSCARSNAPHERMSLAQQLLLRALVARFWRHPYEARLTRWGTALHDRFMLPYFIWQDFEDVIEEVVRAGYRLDADWFRPHFEFRFPLAGEMACAARRSRCARRSSPGPCSVKRDRSAPRCATSIPRWSGCRCTSPVSSTIASS